MKQYEYIAVQPDVIAQDHPIGHRTGPELLNALGREGWLLLEMLNRGKDTEEWLLCRERETEGGSGK